MQKASVLLIAVGGVLGLGIALSFYGNQVLFEGLARGEDDVMAGEDMVIPAELQRSDLGGIYAVQIYDYDGEDIYVHVLDPYNAEIGAERIDGDLFEGRFAVDSDGVYKLVVRNEGSGPVKIFGVVGPEPDAWAKSLGFVSLYVLVIGLLGMAVVGVFVVRGRRRS